MLVDKQTSQDMKMYETALQMELKIRYERENMLKQIEHANEVKLSQAELEIRRAEIHNKYIKTFNDVKQSVREEEQERYSRLIFQMKQQHTRQMDDLKLQCERQEIANNAKYRSEISDLK